jgi:Ca-activated chloride channel family protein
VIDLFGIEFRQPLLLITAVVAIPVFILGYRGAGRITFSSLSILPSRHQSWRVRLAWLPDALVALGIVAFAIALAGPRLANKKSKVRREGIAIMMVVDTSSSMRALDLSEGDEELTRLDAVKKVFREFVNGNDTLAGRTDDAVGIISFARFADTRCPLTLDHDNVSAVANTVELVEDLNEDGTAIGDGLGLAVERLRESKAKSRVAILLTDGVNNAGEETPMGAAELAKTVGVTVYTIGAGTNKRFAPVREEIYPGRTVLRQTMVEIDEETLKRIAERTGGRYFRATDHSALEHIYAEIDRLTRTELLEERYREFREFFPHAIGLGLLLFMLGFGLRSSMFRRLPC